MQLQNFIDDKKIYANSYIDKIYEILGRIFKEALKRDYILKNLHRDIFIIALYITLILNKKQPKKLIFLSNLGCSFLVGREGFEPSYSNENRFTVCRL